MSEKATDIVDKLILVMAMAQHIAGHFPKVPGVEFEGFLPARPEWGWPDICEKS